MADSEFHMNDPVKDEADDVPDGYILRCRGLPYSATSEDLKKFFSACNITNVFLTQTNEGRPTGEAFLELEDEDSYDSGLKMNKEHIGKRYIEVFESDKQEMDYQIKKSTHGSTAADGVIRMRGLPFNCTREDIIEFFHGQFLIRLSKHCDHCVLVLPGNYDIRGRD